MVVDDDTTPPVTTCSLDPAEPDGQNGWYIGSVTVFLNATDDLSGVNITRYRVDGSPWETYIEPFLLEKQGAGIVIEYYSVDNAGNIEPVKNRSINRDTTKPVLTIDYSVQGGRPFGFFIIFTVTASDDLYGIHSGMNRVEFLLVLDSIRMIRFLALALSIGLSIQINTGSEGSSAIRSLPMIT